MEWKEVIPKSNEWKRQLDAKDNSEDVGSIVYYGEENGWKYIVAGDTYNMKAKTLEDAKKEMEDILCAILLGGFLIVESYPYYKKFR